jgi:hypothetical protein
MLTWIVMMMMYSYLRLLPCLCDALNRQSKRVQILERVVMEAIKLL